MRHFHEYELVSREMYEKYGEDCLALFDPQALLMLDEARDFFGDPLIVNDWKWGGRFSHRGARTPDEAAALGAPHSMHITDPEHGILCRAFDFDVLGLRAEVARNKILSKKNHPLLARVTRVEAGVNWVHIDCKPLVAPQKRIHIFKK